MKYLIWICVFVTYMLMFVGIFRLIGNMTRAMEIDILSTLAMLLTLGGSFAAANALSAYWVSDEGRKSTKAEALVSVGTYAALFFTLKPLFGISAIDNLFTLTGILFVAAICIGAYVASAFLCKLLPGGRKTTAA